ncbi:MAG: DUF814 domain-containing protein [Ignavibacteriales bacterium]|nr:DUF814 domain-containing protein [Ignavibacteriales bacterium]
MPVNYFTLKALSGELHSILQGAVIKEVFTQHRNELLITFDCSPNHSAKEQIKTLFTSVEPKFNYIFLRENVSRAKKNSVDLFTEILESTVQQISIHPVDRILFMDLQPTKRLLIQLYNTIESNIFLIDDKYSIIEAFKRNKALRGSVFQFRAGRISEIFFSDPDDFIKELKSKSALDIDLRLKQMLPALGSTYIHEILYRTQVSGTVQELSTEKLYTIWSELNKIFLELSNPEPMIVYAEGEEKILSLIRLDHLADKKGDNYSSVNESIRSFIAKSFHLKSFEMGKIELSKKLREDLEQSERTLIKMEEQRSKTDKDYEKWGRMILANLYIIRKGMNHIDLPDLIEGAKLVRIQLDPAITPMKNAEKYFEKAKKAKVADEELKDRFNRFQNKLTVLRKFLSELENCLTDDDLKTFITKNRERLKGMKLLKEKKEDVVPPFRIFNVVGSYEVWVGKSSKNNDLLTMKYSKPNDVWFHARGASGSHTVLKVKGGVKTIPKEAIRQTASIAAYYSKMRKASTVPVAYCERKYVRKTKGAPEGTVVLDREEVIFVTPSLP